MHLIAAIAAAIVIAYVVIRLLPQIAFVVVGMLLAAVGWLVWDFYAGAYGDQIAIGFFGLAVLLPFFIYFLVPGGKKAESPGNPPSVAGSD